MQRWQVLGLPLALFLVSCSKSGGSTVPATVSIAPALQVVQISPAEGTPSVPVASVVLAVFAEPIEGKSLSPASFVLSYASGPQQIAGSVGLSADGTVASFTPKAPLPSGATLRATLAESIMAMSGAKLTESSSWTFTVQDVVAPIVVYHSPGNGTVLASVLSKPRADFSEPLDPASWLPGSFRLVGPAGEVPTQLQITTQGAVLHPLLPLAELTPYTATVSGVSDLAGNAMPAPFSWSFSTTDTVLPTLLSTDPANGEIDFPLDGSVTAVFSENLDPSTVNDTSFFLQDDQGNLVPATVSAAGNQATLLPTSALTKLSNYTATLKGSIADPSGNQMGFDYSWSFSTEIGVAGSLVLLDADDTSDALNPRVAADPSTGAALAVWVQKSNAKDSIWSSYFDPQTTIWSAPVLVEADDSFAAANPQVVANPVGAEFVACWEQRATGDPSVRIYAHRFVPGTGWAGFPATGASPVAISSTSPASSLPRLIVNPTNGDLHASWLQAPSSTAKVAATWALYLAGSGWQAQAPIGSDPLSNVSEPVELAFDAGTGMVYAAWSQKVDDDGNAKINANDRVSVLGNAYLPGTGWNAAYTLLENDNASDASQVRLTVHPNGDAVAAWVQPEGTKRPSIYSRSARYDAGNAGWVFPQAAAVLLENDNAGDAAEPQIAASASGSLFVVWHQKALTAAAALEDSIFAREYDPSDPTLWNAAGAFLLETGETGPANFAQIDADAAGNFFVVWKQRDAAGISHAMERIFVSGSGWAAAIPLEQNPGNADNALDVAAGLGGTAFAVWSQLNPGTGLKDVWGNRFP